MAERPPISQVDLEKLLAHRTVQMRLLKIAYNRARSVADAEDLVHQTAVIILGGTSPWRPDPDRPIPEQVESFLLHAALIIRRCHLNQVTSRQFTREGTLPDGLEDTTGDGRSNVEQTVVEIEQDQEWERRAAAWTDALCERMAKDVEAVAVLGQHRAGVHETQAQAKALHWTLARVILAKRRIAYHAPVVMREQLEAEQRADTERIAAASAAEKSQKTSKREVQP